MAQSQIGVGLLASLAAQLFAYLHQSVSLKSIDNRFVSAFVRRRNQQSFVAVRLFSECTHRLLADGTEHTVWRRAPLTPVAPHTGPDRLSVGSLASRCPSLSVRESRAVLRRRRDRTAASEPCPPGTASRTWNGPLTAPTGPAGVPVWVKVRSEAGCRQLGRPAGARCPRHRSVTLTLTVCSGTPGADGTAGHTARR